MALAPAGSVARTTNDFLPLTLGFPEMTPLALRRRPFGRAPDASDHLKVPVPPLAARLAEYRRPTLPGLSEWVAMDNGGGRNTMPAVLLPIMIGVPTLPVLAATG